MVFKAWLAIWEKKLGGHQVAFNWFLKKTVHTIPVSGFLLRSDLVPKYSNLKVSTDSSTTDSPVIRHKIMADGLMLCLFNRSIGAMEVLG
jgi:hypothetical protein